MASEHAAGSGPAHDAKPGPSAMLAIGCSAGSLPVLRELIRGLPAQLPAAVLICQHTSQHGGSNLPEILSRSSVLPAAWAADGGQLEAGRIYVAPPGHHLMAAGGQTRLSSGPRVNRHRPSVDVLFASVARSVGPAATGVVLSGVLDDGAVGAALIDRAGGQVLVQDPATAQFAAMPRAALKAAPGARIMHDRLGDEVAAAIDSALRRKMERPMTDESSPGTDFHGRQQDRPFLQPGESRLVRLVCPDCGGALAQVDLPNISYFRCHVGHQYGPESLMAAMSDASESRLWGAVAALEEEALLQDYVRGLPGTSSTGATHTGRARRGAEGLWGRAAELRRQVERWTAQAPAPNDQSSAGETS